MHAPQRVAPIAGPLYLIVGIGGAFAEIVRVMVYQAGDAATTATNVATHAGPVHASVVADLVAKAAGILAMAKPTRVTNSIRVLRLVHGEMTQADLADRLSVTRQTVIAIEQGRYSPSLGGLPDRPGVQRAA